MGSGYLAPAVIYNAGTISMFMKTILNVRKMENGIAVYYEDYGVTKFESFNFSELIDMKINALDLLEDYKNYEVDTTKHTLIMVK